MKPTDWSLKPGTTWADKLKATHPNHGKIVPASAVQRKKGISRVLIPRPLDVDALIRRVPKGRLITIGQLHEALAQSAGADAACPLTTGIFLRIAAEATEERRREGRKRITPYWRVIDNKGGLKERFPGGVKAQAKRLRAEGFTISPARGKQPPRVKGFKDYLIASA